MKYSMAAVIDDHSIILILGSLPGERSLQMQEYYAHPQNQFWKIMSVILSREMPESYSEKKQMLLENKIALWDMVFAAERKNSSLDGRIKNVIPNNIEGLLRDHPHIRRILLNGGKTSQLFNKYYSHLNVQAVSLPSTSPAYASMRLEEKIKRWKESLEKEVTLGSKGLISS